LKRVNVNTLGLCVSFINNICQVNGSKKEKELLFLNHECAGGRGILSMIGVFGPAVVTDEEMMNNNEHR
jgi:hypothetical protein